MVDKQDFMYVILAIVVVLLIALIIKPAATDDAPGFRWPIGPAPTTEPTLMSLPTPPPTTIAPAPTPTPMLTWDGKPREIEFVDPATYQIPREESQPNATIAQHATPPDSTKWVTYATIDGQWSGTTGIVRIPFPLWRLDYSSITPMNYESSQFNCQVMDAEDPNRFVHIVTLTSSDFRGMNDKPDLRKEQWVKTFYEGHHDYYFVINTRCIKSYHLEIQVPETYADTAT